MALCGRQWAFLALFALLVSLLPHAQPAAARTARAQAPASRQGAATGAIIAVALNGDIYALPADGRGRRRLTTSGRAWAPRLSPDGRLVAYFQATSRPPAASPNPPGAVYVLPVQAPAGTPAKQLCGGHRTAGSTWLVWAPDGSGVAYLQGSTLTFCAVQKPSAAILLPSPRGTSYAGDLAWSPDGHQIAVPLFQPAAASVQGMLLVALGSMPGGQWRRLVVRFPAGAVGVRAGTLPVSVPGSNLEWTPDGRGLLFSTVFAGEGPPNMSGIWRVGLAGGVAHLAIGTTAGVQHSPLPAGNPLQQATQFQLSPDRSRLATDPVPGLWVALANGHAGRFLPVRVAPRCVLAQYTWLPNGSGLAYVQVCPMTGPQARVRATLFSVGLDGSPPRQLYQATSPDQQAIDLAPSYRCVLCGY